MAIRYFKAGAKMLKAEVSIKKSEAPAPSEIPLSC